MQNQLCRVCEEPAAGFHFGAFTCEGCKSFFGRTCNNQSVIQECKNNYQCVVDKKNRTACKACRLRKCLLVGMSKSGSRYGRRSNWFKIHCLMQQNINGQQQPAAKKASPPGSTSSTSTSSLSPTMPLNIWPSPPKTEPSPKESHLNSIIHRAPSSSPPRSPEISPTMVPRTSSVGSSSFIPSASSSPFKGLIPASLPPLTTAVPAATTTVKSTASPEITTTPPSMPPNPLAAAAAAAPGLASLYSAGFPSPLSLMGAPAFPGIPFHKQALLSPLLAQSHLWQMAAARHHPLFAGLRPEVDILAEHKALMERFAAASAASSAGSGSSSGPNSPDAASSSTSPPPASAAVVPPAAPAAASVPPPSKSPRQPPLQHTPMDLSSSKRSDEEDSDDEDIVDVVKSDVNRNNLVNGEEGGLNLSKSSWKQTQTYLFLVSSFLCVFK